MKDHKEKDHKEKTFQKGICNIPTHNFRVFGFSLEENARHDIPAKLKIEEKTPVYKSLKENGIDEAVIISSCNRLQVYYFADENKSEQISRTFSKHNIAQPTRAIDLEGNFAVRHFLETSTGMRSFVTGDHGIDEQFNTAAEEARANNASGMHMKRIYGKMNELKAQDFLEGKKAPSDVDQVFHDIDSNHEINSPKHILIVGTGNIGRLGVNGLRDSGNQYLRNSHITVISTKETRLNKFMSKRSVDEGVIYNERSSEKPDMSKYDIIIMGNELKGLFDKDNFKENALFYNVTSDNSLKLNIKKENYIDLEALQEGLNKREKTKEVFSERESIIFKISNFAQANFHPDSVGEVDNPNTKMMLKIARDKYGNDLTCKAWDHVDELGEVKYKAVGSLGR